MNTKQDIDKAVKEILFELKTGYKVRQTHAIDNLEAFERKIRNEESTRLKLIGRVLVRQQLFPEKAHAILSEETLDGMEIETLEFIKDSYEVSEDDISAKLIK